MIDALTAAVALAGTALAIYLWSWTRKYILTTRADITAAVVLRVGNAVTALKAEVHQTLDPMIAELRELKTKLEASKVDFSPLDASFEKRFQGLTAQLDRKLDDVKAGLAGATIDINAEDLAGSLDMEKFAKQLYAHIKADEGVAARKLQAELERLGGPLKAVEEGLIAEVSKAGNATDVALMRYLNFDVSPDFRERFPDRAAWLDQAKVAWAQTVQIMREFKGMAAQASNSEVVAGSRASGSGSWNAGLRER